MFIEQHGSAEKILESVRQQLPRFREEYGFFPVIIMIKNTGLLAVENSAASAEKALDVYEDLIKVSYYSSLCGGIKPLTPDQAAFIDKWEVENYRRKITQSTRHENKLSNKIAIITGGAQGFGAGIAEALFRMQVNVVIGDLNTEAGNKLVSGLNDSGSPNKAVFVRTDVADPESVKYLVKTAVKEFGGLDIMVSNAGVLKAGGLDEMEPDQFNRQQTSITTVIFIAQNMPQR
jgi:FlaA1/EpsC-like NDP-sugar epimerase